ncbi:hypothetical protein [Mucilaginibacter dorajii]|uniref:Uncharacterized protein n=1 Tax=Mucilaginibacter dorajii TaxID=692994 RepID=A0ABP7PUT5_9SPHI|nr:hypothetical protein [Mucilaginibacter dorajii]MCS3735007.1 hypothetical protein [Mucilaginibacter dorajii]
MANIQFNYLYRDGGNYKKYGSVVLANPTGLGLAELTALIRSNLIDQTWFYVAHAGIPDLTPNTFNPETDPTWHEFESIGLTAAPVSMKMDVLGFVELLEIEI